MRLQTQYTRTMRADDVRSSTVVHYGIAVVAACAAAATRIALTPFFQDRNQLVMFYPAIMVSAWMGGVWPGIVATLTSAALTGFFFLEPLSNVRVISHGDKLALAIFVVTGTVISVLNENLRRVAAREQKMRAEAERARADADAANRTKDFFLAAVSHDLRAPMTAAVGWADMLSKGMLDSAQRQHAIEAIRRAMTRQLVLVNDLLDRAAILSGQLRVEQKTVNIDSVIRAAVEVAEPLAATKRLNITVNCEQPPAMVLGDSLRLQQVLANLLTNAIKFTPEGGDIHVRAQRADAHAEIQVTDTGRGLPRGALPFVFERFWQHQHDRSPTRDQGVGLGLAIAKHLVLAHHGTIDVSSDGEGRGATFRVRLPLSHTDAAQRNEAHLQERSQLWLDAQR